MPRRPDEQPRSPPGPGDARCPSAGPLRAAQGGQKATSRSAGAGDAGGAGGPLPRPASPGRQQAAPPAAGGRPGTDLTAAEAPRRRERRGKCTARRPPALVPSQRQSGRRSSASRVCAPGSRSEWACSQLRKDTEQLQGCPSRPCAMHAACSPPEAGTRPAIPRPTRTEPSPQPLPQPSNYGVLFAPHPQLSTFRGTTATKRAWGLSAAPVPGLGAPASPVRDAC
ncbi:hypothetical protein MC885_010480 [Smutsia gigantea]|nr:hypothetical protein MC885_010480 [Smutsia gigantea]